MKKKLIAVYGSLRKGFHNHYIIENANFLGEFKTEPIYSLYGLGGFPGLKEKGTTSVTMEVYEVNETEASRVDMLEGYEEGRNNTFYDKKTINTPYGEASTYIYVPNVNENRLVESGDWKNLKTEKMYG